MLRFPYDSVIYIKISITIRYNMGSGNSLSIFKAPIDMKLFIYNLYLKKKLLIILVYNLSIFSFIDVFLGLDGKTLGLVELQIVSEVEKFDN